MNKNRRLEILGILIVSISVFILISLLGYNVSEEPTISPNVKIENPMGILGVFISHFLDQTILWIFNNYIANCRDLLGMVFIFEKTIG